jgi:hypothetical protein
MNMKRKGPLNDVIRVFTELQGRRLWKRFSNSHCFAVEAAGEKDPLLASVMGAGGEEYGLMLLRGPGAVGQLISLQSFGHLGNDAVEEADLLSIGLEVFGDMPPDFTALYRRAGIHPRFDEKVPYVMVKRPACRARAPGDAELVLLRNVLEAVVAADRRKLLVPAGHDDREGICIVTCAGRKGGELSVRRERLAHRPPPGKIDFSLSPHDLVGLGLLDETWLVGTPTLPCGVEGDDRAMQLLLVVNEADSMVLGARPFFADQMREAMSMLMETFQGNRLKGDSKGMPRRIVFSSRVLHDATAPALRKAGVQCEYLQAIPGLQDVLADLIDSVTNSMARMDTDPDREDSREEVPAPDDLAGWKAADFRLCQRTMDSFYGGDRSRSTRAAKRYFDDPDSGHYLKEHEKRGVAMAYASWGVADYRPTRKGKTLAEKMLASGLPPAQERLLRSRMESAPSIHRVAGHDPEAGTIDLDDVLLGGTVKIWDQRLSENISDNMFIPARVFAAGGFHFLESIGPPLSAGMGMEAAAFLAECRMEFTHEGLKRDANMFGWLWGWIEEWEANWRPPHLCNTDGDDLLLHTASFSTIDPEAARRAVRDRPDVEYDDREDEFVWTRETGRSAQTLGGPVTLGRIEFIGDELVLSVNSARRFEEARKWLEKLPGIEFQSVTTRRIDEPEEDRPMDERIAKPEAVEVTGEMADALQEMMDKHFMDWVDIPVPALGDISPRDACRTPEGRRKVTLMIRTMPDPIGNAPIQVPREAMLRSLGLKTGPEESEPSASPAPGPAVSSPLPPGGGKVGRNAPCPCGSGKKYKKCCGR